MGVTMQTYQNHPRWSIILIRPLESTIIMIVCILHYDSL
jgi:hypothetical protein